MSLQVSASDVVITAWGATCRDLHAGGYHYFEFLTGVDEGEAVAVILRVAALNPWRPVHLRTLVGPGQRLESVVEVWAGAGWHEREVAEMFGVGFADPDGTPKALDPLLLGPLSSHAAPPLRKDVWLGARTETAWPGAKDPTDSTGRTRRRLRPPGVPEEPR